MKPITPSLVFAFILFLSSASSLLAGNATWNALPVSNDWNDPLNWTPQTVPQGETDIATFGVSDITNLDFANTYLYLGGLVFNPGASSYTINGFEAFFSGLGVINNSGMVQTVDTDIGFSFSDASRAGDNVTYLVHPNNYADSYFFDESSAGTATILVDGGVGSGTPGGDISFSGSASAAESAIVLAPGDVYGGEAGFGGFSNAGGSTISAAAHASVYFYDYANAGTATIAADGAKVSFEDNAIGAAASLNLSNGATLDLSRHDATAIMTVGPLTTDATSTIDLGGTTLSIFGPSFRGYTSNIAGVISGTGGIVLGEGTEVTFSGVNTYTGGTTINGGGKLILMAAKGSATGTGPVKVVNGSLGGNGLIGGAVSLGGVRQVQQANLNPMIALPVALRIKKTLSFANFSAYQWRLNSSKASGVEVAAKGITISGSAAFNVLAPFGADIPVGTVFTVLSNTARTPISGRFTNLPDGGTISAGGNTMQVDYEGGDGNDLTLTVIQNSHATLLPTNH